MNAEDALKLARRFIGLPVEKRQLFLAALAREGVDFAQFPIPADVPAEDRQALSYAQRRMWVLWQLDPHSGAYNLPGAVRLKGALDINALERAFANLIERHQTLRTVFRRRDDDSVQQVPAEQPLHIVHQDFSALAIDAREQAVREAAEAQAVQPFDLEQGPLLRVSLLRLASDEHVLLLTLHHIVSDGWSMNVLIEEFTRCYDAFALGKNPALAPLPVQYADYALWQRRWLEAGEQARQLSYWQDALGNEHDPLELPTDHPRPALPSQRGRRLEFAIDTALADGLRELARQHNVTLFMLLLGAFNVLLLRYTGQTDLRVGVPIANRNRSEIEGLIGFFVNTLVLRTQVDALQPFASLLQAVKERVLGAQAHQDLPFEQVVEALQLERSLSHTPLFQVMYNHQPHVADMASLQTAAGLSLSAVQWQSRTTQFDLTLDTYEQGGQLRGALTYADELFDAATIARMAKHFTGLLAALVADPNQRVGELALLADEEHDTLISGWNQTAQAYPLDQCLHSLIGEQVQRTPDAPAVRFAEQTLSYAALERHANQLANLLRERGVGPDVLVGVCLERSLEMVVALLAIHKAGGAYVPLDPEYPQERLHYMIDDSAVRLLLTQRALRPLLEGQAGLQMIDLDQPQGWLDGYSEQAPLSQTLPQHLAYVIYTSGSTGKPKGAGNSHAALVNRLCWMQQAYALTSSDVVLQKTPFSFDVSVWEFFWPLLTGACLVVAAPGAHRDPERLIETIVDNGVTTLHFVPSMLQAFIHEHGVEACHSLQRIVCSGEALPLEAQQQVFARLPQAALYNLYGPTEAAIDVTHWTCIDEGALAVPIGQPIANLRTLVLDAQLQPVPAGVAGELYLGGIGLARSYHRRPGLTAERFVACPFVAGERLYRTGDRVRQRRDGVIEYLGRFDHQVKLRGLRIELGEIETRLMQQPQVDEAVVLVQEGKHLVAYLVLAQEPQEGWQAQLKHALLECLPEYMVPTYWLALDQLPVTANGKLDRKALPLPEAAPQQTYVAPQDELQRLLAGIWQDVLGLAQVGLEDNFFELGGDSIVSIQVVSRARQAGVRLKPRDLFQHQTVRSLAQVAVRDSQGQQEQGPATGDVQLTPIQHAFFALDMPQRSHWNQSLLLSPREPVQAEVLAQALQLLLAQHDALRLRYTAQTQGWQQAYAPVSSARVLESAQVADTAQLAALCDGVQCSLDLQTGPLLRALLVELPDGEQRLLLVIHHLVVDGVSWRVLLEDLQLAYQQLAAGQPARLPAKTSSYQAWAARLQQHVPAVLDQLPYWLAQHQDIAELPCDRPHGALTNQLQRKVEARLSREATRQLLQVAPAAYRTQVNDLLLTALARLLQRWTAQPGCLIQLEGHGREDLGDDLDLTRSVGWFTSLFPVRLQVPADWPGSIKAVKEQLRRVPGKGLGYGLLRYLAEPAVGAQLAALPAPRVTFNYLGQFDGQFDQAALFAPASERSGQAQDPQAPLANWLTVEGQVYAGELTLQWGYSSAMYDDASIQQLADGYLQELHALIAHCLQVPAGQVTPSDFPLASISPAQLDQLPASADQIEDLYPLAPMQQGMLFHSLYQPADGAYVNQMRLDIAGLDVERFRQAWQAALDHHPILRSSIHWQGLEHAHQLVHRQLQLPLTLLEAGEHDLDQLAAAERALGFDLARAPLLRLSLVPTGSGDWHLIYTSHHILLDGWSNASLLAEVLGRYAGIQPSAAPGRYRDYLAWLQGRSAEAAKSYWQVNLAALEQPTLLAESLRRPAHGSGYGQLLTELEPVQTEALKAFARAHKVTLNTLLQGAWAVLLQRYSGQACVAFGATVAGRPAELPGIDAQLGLFINTLPIVCQPHPQHSVAQWLQALQSHNLALREFEHVPLYEIQAWAGQQGNALFDSLLVFENFPVAEALSQADSSGLRMRNLSNHEQTSYPLTLGIELGATLRLDFSYDLARFSSEQVAGLCSQLRHLLEQFVAAPQGVLGNLTLLDNTGQHNLLQRQGDSCMALRDQALVHQRIAVQAASTPGALAVWTSAASLDYASLNQQANRLAHCLIESGVGPGQRVGLALRRTPQLIVSLLAVLKSGAAYVPLDPSYPDERLLFMVEDSRLDLLLSEGELLAHLALPAGLTRLQLDALGDQLANASTLEPANRACPEDLAYVIYTSGSTGKPKGVAIAHAALREFCESAADYSRLAASDRVLQFATFSFDGFVEQCYPPLSVGAALIMRDDQPWSVEQLAEVLVEQGVTLADLPAAYWHLLAKLCASEGSSPGRLRQVHVGGEAMSVEGLRLWHAAGLGAVRLVNTYGPTEATVVSSVHDCQLADASAVYGVPIGQAIAGRSLRILDAGAELLPAGATGELWIGAAASLAQCYFDRPALTAERFLPDPFASEPGARLYRSGDLVRYNPAGAIEYVGRIDHQVKIRGFRIELGEIEARLAAQPAVREAVVVALPARHGLQLVAYVVPVDDLEALAVPAQDDLRGVIQDALKADLPDYMQPNQLILLARLPLNPNGKLDRKALPAPQAISHSQALPQTDLQRRVAAIWQSVLDVAQVGLGDNFFALGGHSLLATQVISRVRQELGVQLALRSLFEAATLQDFVASIEHSERAASMPVLRRVDERQPQLQSFAQQRLWFLWQLEPHSSMYNIARALELTGTLDPRAVRQAFDMLVQRHAVLRTTYFEADGEHWQQVHQQLAPEFAFTDLRGSAEGQAALEQHLQSEARQPFDLVDGSPMRVRLLRLSEQRHVLLITLHHIVADHWSFGLLPAEFVSLYQAARSSSPSALPEPRLQYVDFAVWQREWLATGELERQLAYWRAQLGDDHRLTSLPASPARQAASANAAYCEVHEFHFSPALSEALREFATARGVTLYMLLLAGFSVVVAQRSASSRVRLGTDVANRNHAGVEDLVGFFVNQLVLQLTVEPQASVSQLLEAARSTVIGAADHQDLPFERLVEALRVPRRAGRSPLFAIKFIYQDSSDVPLSIDGLEIQPLPAGKAAAELDLIAEFVNAPAGIYLGLKCDAGLYASTDMACLFGQLQGVFEHMLGDPQAALAQLLEGAAQVQQAAEQQALAERQAQLQQQPIQRRRPGRVAVE